MKTKRVRDINSKNIYLYVRDVSAETGKLLMETSGCKAYQDGFLLPESNENRRLLFDIHTKDSKARYTMEKMQRDACYQAILESRAEGSAFAEDMKQAISSRKPVEGYNGRCPELMNHQKAASMIADRFDKYAFFFDTGTGKTLLALDIIDKKADVAQAHFLIICPKTIIQAAWLQDCRRFFPKLKLLPLLKTLTINDYARIHYHWASAHGEDTYAPTKFYEGSKSNRLAFASKYLLRQAQHFIVNPELFIRDPKKYLHIDCGGRIIHIDGLIVDESAMMKNSDSSISKTVIRIASEMKYLYLLSGKPAPNKVAEYYPQIKAVAPELLSSEFKSSLRNEGKNLSQESAKELLKVVDMASITVSKQDCFDLPPTTNMIRQVQLTPEVMAQYQNMKWNLYADIETFDESDRKLGNFVYVNHILAGISKIRQIASGFIIDKGSPTHIHDQKLHDLLNIIQELGDSQALIWCQYRYEIEHIEAALRKQQYSVVTAYGGTKDKNDSIHRFKTKKAQFLIAHPRTLQYGVTLTNCTYAIYYSTSYSFEEYYQSHDRIYRKGQTQPCTYIFIQAENTIDEIMYDTIQNKKTRAELVEAVLKHLTILANDYMEVD